MKKSTLITTIAMIVVVVVALSTATYAWFTSSTSSVASATISVQSASGWNIAGTSNKSITTGVETATFDSATEISTLDMPNGLYSPVGDLSTNKIGATDTTSATLTLNNWFTTFQNGTSLVPNVDVLDSKVTNTPVPVEKADPKSMANYIRITNTNGHDEYLTLTLTVYLAATAPTTSQFLAAEKFSSFITWRTISEAGVVDTKAYYANTPYTYGTQGNAGTGTGENANHTYSKTDVVISTTEETYSTGKTGFAVSPSLTSSSSGNYGYTAASSTNLSTSYAPAVKNAGFYYQYELDFGKIDNNATVVLALYTWFDGWKITSTTTDCSADVYLAFNTTPQARIPSDD